MRLLKENLALPRVFFFCTGAEFTQIIARLSAALAHLGTPRMDDTF